jgi:predicted peptidase
MVHMKCLYLIFILIFFSVESSFGQGKQRSKQIVSTTNYLLFLPEGYDQDSKKKWPLILFLHGASKRGKNINKVKEAGLPKIAEEEKNFPFIVVSPQCPEGQWWSIPMLNIILDEVTVQNR